MFFQRDKITQSIGGRTNNHWQSVCLLLGVTALGNNLCLRRKIRVKWTENVQSSSDFRPVFTIFMNVFDHTDVGQLSSLLKEIKRRYNIWCFCYWYGFANPCLLGSSKVLVLSRAELNDVTSIYEVRNEYMYQIWTEGEWGTVGGCKVVGCRMYHAGAGCRPPPLPRAPRGAAHPQQQHFSLRPGILHLVQRFCHK